MLYEPRIGVVELVMNPLSNAIIVFTEDIVAPAMIIFGATLATCTLLHILGII